jgi:hypothetical protein
MAKRSLKELKRLLSLAGAKDAESWAQSEVDEDIPQLARFLFLRQAWKQVLGEGDTEWLSAEIASAEKSPTAPGAGYGQALHRLVAAGASPADLSSVARHAQWQLLSRLCYLLEDPQIAEPELEGVGWVLLEMDAEGNVGRPIGGLHESVLETDPTGREMRPRPVA